MGQGRGQYIMEWIMGQKYDLQTWFQKSWDTVYKQNIENVLILFDILSTENSRQYLMFDLINFDYFC